MSMGRPAREEVIKIHRFDKIQFAFKKVIEKYFESPLYYLFYTMFIVTVTGLFFGKEFSVVYYVLFLALALAELYRHRNTLL